MTSSPTFGSPEVPVASDGHDSTSSDESTNTIDVITNSDSDAGYNAIIFMNIQNLISKTKTDKIKFLTEQASHDKALIIALTETHLNDTVLEAEINITNYTIFRQDRTGGRRNGGIATYVHSSIAAQCQLIKTFSNNYIEFNILYFSKLEMLLINMYRPPDCQTNLFNEALQEIQETIEEYNENFPTTIITGDLNFPETNWGIGQSSEVRSENKQQAESLIKLTSDLLCNQIIDQPTRINNILDLFFVNNTEVVRDYFVENTVASDHNVITVQTNLNCKLSRVHPNKDIFFNTLNFNHKRTDWTKIQLSIHQTPWETIFRNRDPKYQYDILHATCMKICSEFVPKRVKSKHRRISRAREALRRSKRKSAKKLKIALRTQNSQNIQDLREKMIRKDAQLQDLIKSEQLQEELKVIESIKTNPKCFYGYASKKAKIKSGIGPLRNEANDIVDDPQSMSEILRQQYENVFAEPDVSKQINDPKLLFSQSSPLDITDIEISENLITNAIKTLKKHSAAGPDEFPAILLKKCSNALAKPLALLYRNMLDTGIIPQELKTAHITPIHKKGPKSLAKNYRPVALTSHIIKIFEKVLAKQLANYLEDNNKMNPAQHGFRQGRSCLSQLLTHQENIIASLAKGFMVDVINLDYAKAFDTVDHGILLHKIKNLGISGKLGIWISNFLQNRIQKVVIDGYKSQPSPVVSGVPQGSVLGPSLFIIHLGDIGHDIQNSTVSSFADDTRIYKEIKNLQDVKDLQKDLHKIYKWSEENNLSLNGEKFEHMRYGTNKGGDLGPPYLTPDGQNISEKESVRDLGVILSNNAKFEKHIAKKVKTARAMSAWILRTFTAARDEDTMLTLYKAYVRSHLEYCCQLWNPFLIKDISLIESVQQAFTKRIRNLENLNYWQRLEKLKLYSLQRRRERYLTIHTWKILNGKALNVVTSISEGIRYKSSSINSRLGRTCVVPTLTQTASVAIQR